MERVEFIEPLTHLAGAFGNTLKEERIEAYFDVFKNITGKDWIEICERAILNYDRFPTVKELCRLAYELGAFGKKQRESDYGLYVCECGELMAFNKNIAAQHPEYWIDCPKKFYGTCNKSFQMGLMLKNMEKPI